MSLKFKRKLSLLPIVLLIILAGCQLEKTDDFCPAPCPDFIQNFDKSAKYRNEEYLKVYLSQSVYPLDSANQKAGVTKLYVKNVSGYLLDTVAILVSVYKNSQFTYDNLLYTQTYKSFSTLNDQDTTVSFLLSNSSSDIIIKENVVVEIIHLVRNGINHTNRFAGLYSGNFYTSIGSGADSVLKYFKTCGGNINADGSIRFSLDGEKEYRILKGEVDGSSGTCIASVNKADDIKITDVSTSGSSLISLIPSSNASGTDTLAMLLKTTSQFQDFSTIKIIANRLKP